VGPVGTSGLSGASEGEAVSLIGGGDERRVGGSRAVQDVGYQIVSIAHSVLKLADQVRMLIISMYFAWTLVFRWNDAINNTMKFEINREGHKRQDKCTCSN